MIKTLAFELSRVLLKLAMDRALRKALPAILKRLDLVLPYLTAQRATPLQVQCAVTNAIEEKIGRIATPTQIGVVLAMHDVTKAALSNSQR